LLLFTPATSQHPPDFLKKSWDLRFGPIREVVEFIGLAEMDTWEFASEATYRTSRHPPIGLTM